MTRHEFFTGANFSGRSERMLARLREAGAASFFIGPYAEAALSGLSTTVADEIALYRAQSTRPAFEGLDAAHARKPQSLSGGEQVLLALHCLSVSGYGAVAIDTALEQLDRDNRTRALAFLDGCGRDIALIDNRLAQPAGFDCTVCEASGGYACDWDALAAAIVPRSAPEIAVSNLSFRYRGGQDIFRGASVTLAAGHAYRLSGRNGAGKTTFLKILVGALAPAGGKVTLGGARYEPWNGGNLALAMAAQNPDHQWCGATLAEDVARRRRALAGRGDAGALDAARVTALASAFGLASLDQHLYELPLAARKRVSWLWPLAGAHPWIMLDEPTIGQDIATRESLANLIAKLCTAGYGIIMVTHDDEFAACVPHRLLLVESGEITPR